MTSLLRIAVLGTLLILPACGKKGELRPPVAQAPTSITAPASS